MMAGKNIYLTELQIEMIYHAFQPGNFSFEGKEDSEKRELAADDLIRKVSK